MPHDLSVQHRARQIGIQASLVRELVKLWPTLDASRLDATYPAWAIAAARMVLTHRAASATLANRYLRALRQAQEIPGDSPVVSAPVLPPGQLNTSLLVTSVVSVKAAMSRGVPLAKANQTAFVASSRAASRLALDGGRGVVEAAGTQDPQVIGWQRITSGRACGYCNDLAAAADAFTSHDGCSCTPEPVYR